MTDKLREAAQMALEALERYVQEDETTKRLGEKTISTLREALAEPTHGCHIDLPEGEYDACVLDEGKPSNCVYARMYGIRAKEMCGEWKPIKLTKPHTNQPERKPLTDEQITEIWAAKVRYHAAPIGSTDLEFARAIERAHGIGTEKGESHGR